MNTVVIRHGLGPPQRRRFPVETADARVYPRNVDAAISAVRTAMEEQLDPIDIGRIVGILQPYGRNTPRVSSADARRTRQLAPRLITDEKDAADHPARHSADDFHEEVARNRKIAAGRRAFWENLERLQKGFDSSAGR